MDSFKPPNLFDKDNNKPYGVDGKGDSFTPPNPLHHENAESCIPSTQDKGKRKADGSCSCFELGVCRLTHHSEPVSAFTDYDAGSEAAPESKRYIRSYSPFMDDGFSTDTSVTSTRIKNISEESISTISTDTTQHVKNSGPKASVSKADDHIDSNESVYASAPESEPHMDYEASTLVENPVYPHVLGQGETAEYMDDVDDGDLARSIKGFYRILDLIADQGSGGLGIILHFCPMLCVNG